MDSPAYDVERFPLSSVVTLPIGFSCSQAASKAMLDLLEEYQPQEFENYEIITAFTTEHAYIQSKEPVGKIGRASCRDRAWGSVGGGGGKRERTRRCRSRVE